MVFVVPEEYADDLFYSAVDDENGYNFVSDGDDAGPYRSASFAHGGVDGDLLAVQIDGAGGLPDIWSSAFDPASGDSDHSIRRFRHRAADQRAATAFLGH